MGEDTEAASRRMPWAAVAILCAALALSGGAVGAFLAPGYVPAALAGVIMGVFATYLADVKRAVAAGTTAFLASVCTIWLPVWSVPLILGPVLCLLSGYEIGRFGGRAFGCALLVWVMLMGTGTAQTMHLVAIAYGLPLGFGSLLALRLRIAGMGRMAPAGAAYGWAHAGALSIGLAISFALAWQLDHPAAHWIVTIFVARALDAPGTHTKKAVTSGLMTMAGAACAAVLTFLPLPQLTFVVLGVGLLVLGLRAMPLPNSRSSLFMSAGIVLATAPDLETAEFRGLAAMIAAALAVALVAATNIVAQRVLRVLNL